MKCSFKTVSEQDVDTFDFDRADIAWTVNGTGEAALVERGADVDPGRVDRKSVV